MNFKELLTKLLFPIIKIGDNNLKNKVPLLNLLIYFSLGIFLTTGIRYLYFENFSKSLIFLGIFILIAFIKILFPPQRHYKYTSYSFSLVLLLFFSSSYYFLPEISEIWLFILLYPVANVVLLRPLISLLFSSALLISIIPSFFISSIGETAYTATEFISLTAAYIIVYLFIHLFKKFIDSDNSEYLIKMKKSVDEVQEKNEFISNLSHQLRTSLNNILLVNNLVTSSKLDSKQKDLIDTLQASTNNLIDTVNKIVDISEPDLMPLKETKVSFNLENALESIIKIFRNNESLEIQLNISQNIENFIIGDPIKLKQIFLNILQSIIKQQKDHTQILNISVLPEKTNRESSTILFLMDSCFKPYGTKDFNFENCSETIKLIQYNLSYTHTLVDSVGGTLSESYTKGKYEFKIQLEFERDIYRKIDSGISKLSPETRDYIELKNANVLLVEDNLINQKIVILSLKNIVKNIDAANNGKEALDMFDKTRYDIILMDIQMPIMNGIIATKKIREIESSSNSQTPIIAITANALAGDRENCLAVGMNDYISKPFQVDVLILKMKNLLKV